MKVSINNDIFQISVTIFSHFETKYVNNVENLCLRVCNSSLKLDLQLEVMDRVE